MSNFLSIDSNKPLGVYVGERLSIPGEVLEFTDDIISDFTGMSEDKALDYIALFETMVYNLEKYIAEQDKN